MPYPRKSATLKRLQGNPGHRPIEDDVDAGALAKLPGAPDWLTGEGRKFYQRLGRELVDLGLLARCDVPAFQAAAVEWGRWVKAEEQLAARGEVITTAAGAQMLNPWLTVSNRALDRFCSLFAKFGGTPADRTRVQLVKRGPSAAEEFLTMLQRLRDAAGQVLEGEVIDRSGDGARDAWGLLTDGNADG